VPDRMAGSWLCVGGFGDFDHVDMRWAEHVGAKDNPPAVGRELAVRLQGVIMFGQVDEFLNLKIPAAYQFLRVAGAAGNRRNHMRPIEVNPLAVIRSGHASGSAAVAAIERLVGRDIEMYGPLVLLQVVPCPLLRFDFVAPNPENVASRRLQVVYNALSVGAEELVSVDLIVHKTRLDVGLSVAVGADYPGPVHKLPRPLVTIEHLIRIGRGKLHMIQPGVTPVELVDLPAFQIDGEKLHVTVFIRCAETRSPAAAPVTESLRRFQVECSARQRLVAIDIGDSQTAGDIDDFKVFFGCRVHGTERHPLVTSGYIKGPARFATDAYQPGPPLTNLLNPAGFEVHGIKPARCGKDKLFAVGSELVLMKIGTLAAVLARQPDDSMPGIRVDPVGWNIVLGVNVYTGYEQYGKNNLFDTHGTLLSVKSKQCEPAAIDVYDLAGDKVPRFRCEQNSGADQVFRPAPSFERGIGKNPPVEIYIVPQRLG
jgi:hypothetical protein